MRKKWVSAARGYTALRLTPGARATKLVDLNPLALVTSTGELHTADGIAWERVIYEGAQTYTGWVDSARIETYYENYPKDCVDVSGIQTADKRDAEQFVLWNGLRQVNLCGPLCVCYLLDMPLATMLEKWAATNPPLWRAVFGTLGIARGTGEGELSRMLGVFGEYAEPLSPVYQAWTPGLAARLRGAIVGVRINPLTGRLNGGGVGHWCVLTNVAQERAGGMVFAYNPFPNRIEVYSYAEFAASARVPYGARIVTTP